jgi:Rieske Fe-S protein
MSRQILTRLIILAMIVGIGASSSVLLAGLGPTDDKKPPYLRIDLDTIPLDFYRVVEWRNKPVVVFRPSHKSADLLTALNSQASAPHIYDGLVPPAFVYIKISTNRGCAVEQTQSPPWEAMWRDSCHAGEWDLAGRRLSGEDRFGQPLRNLEVPLFRYSGNNQYLELL